MARIRTIKPEFTQSESIGRLSRDARLLFIQIWTIVDDEGRARASSRGLASGLYPFDDDARNLIDGWLTELSREKLITRYEVDGSTYLVVNNWQKHQKIDRPTASRLPSFDEASRVIDEQSTKPRAPLAADLVPSTLDHGPRTVDRGEAREQVRTAPSHDLEPVSKAKKPRTETPRGTRWPSDAVVPDDWLAEGEAYREMGKLPPLDLRAEALKFANYWAAKSGGSATKIDWKRTWLNWCLTANGPQNVTVRIGGKSQLEQLADIARNGLHGAVIDG
jgi:hypothetical protein